MRLVDVKIVLLSFCVCTTLAYHHASKKEDYSKWRERFLSNKPQPTTTSAPLAISENDIYYENLKLRHHSRFPNLDRVMLKIDNMHGMKKDHIGVMPEPTLHNKIRHQGLQRPTTTSTTTTTTDEGLFGDDYGDDDLEYDDDDMTDYDDWVSSLSLFLINHNPHLLFQSIVLEH